MKRVLVVDDDRQMEVAMCRVFGRAGYKASSARSATEALGLMDKTAFDLVIADVVMDGMDGFELLHEIKERNKALPVVLVTAFSSGEDENRAYREGAFAYLVKPVAREDLLTAADKATEASRDKLVPHKGVGFS